MFDNEHHMTSFLFLTDTLHIHSGSIDIPLLLLYSKVCLFDSLDVAASLFSTEIPPQRLSRLFHKYISTTDRFNCGISEKFHNIC